ncbi:54S ribosomal protein L22, mitochondrial [Myotisia sp. PD_48]|nr:54S ribosomal protein L22, mitochondrial [Myotisia sp. PD_48]
MATVCTAFTSRRLIRSAVSLSSLSQRMITSSAPLKANDTTEGSNSKPNSKSSSLRDSLLATSVDDPQPPPKSKQKITHRPPPIKRGSLSSGSIFDDGDEGPSFSTSGPMPRRPTQATQPAPGQEITEIPSLSERDLLHMERALNPLPHRRARWERKMVIRSVRRKGRLSKKEAILQTEREQQSRSHFFKTSLKKLGPLARQIAGKNVEDAIVQMRFSKKKAAKDVLAFLEQAKNEAIVSRGMGLGRVQESASKDKADGQNTSSPSPVMITLKDGKKHTITDPTAIYIDQAWVNRGPYGTDYDHRARGQIHRLRLPFTALAVVLKEEKTRIREWQDREAKSLKARRSKLWVPLPDRKITTQNQWYSW